MGIALNIDLGELPDEPPELHSLAHRVNVACGGHAGDAASMRAACEHARSAGAFVGAHPSYEDRKNFGRVELSIGADALRESIARQCAALRDVAAPLGVRVEHVKPHGALYHAANRTKELADAVVAGARDSLGTVAIVGPPEGQLRLAAQRAALPYLREGFADRAYLPDGTLQPRGTPGALLEEPAAAAAQARALVASARFDTLCVHSDTPGAVAIARAVRAALEAT